MQYMVRAVSFKGKSKNMAIINNNMIIDRLSRSGWLVISMVGPFKIKLKIRVLSEKVTLFISQGSSMYVSET